jgi:hypothetical protein
MTDHILFLEGENIQISNSIVILTIKNHWFQKRITFPHLLILFSAENN